MHFRLNALQHPGVAAAANVMDEKKKWKMSVVTEAGKKLKQMTALDLKTSCYSNGSE